MSLGRRERWLLLILLLLAAVWGGRSILGGLGVTGGVDRGGVSRSGASGTPPQVAILNLAPLEPEAGEFRPGRDIFRYGTARRQRQPPREQPAPQPKQQPKQSSDSEAKAKPTPPPVDLQFLGSFGPRESLLAALTDGETIYNVREGETVAEKFRVDAIGYESVDIGYVEFPEAEPRRLPAGG